MAKTQYYTPKYSGDFLSQLAQYQTAVQKIDPKYNLSMGIYSPGMENKKQQTNQLINMVLGSRAGAKSAGINKPWTNENIVPHMQSLYGQHGLSPTEQATLKAHNTDVKNKSRFAALQQIQGYLSASEKKGATEQDAIAGLYQQLQDPKKTKKLSQAFADTVAGREAAIQKTPQYQMQYFYNAELLPMVNSKVQQLYDTAAALDQYAATPSKYRAKAFPAGKPSTRGMSQFVPKDQPLTAETIRAAAEQLGSPQGTQQYLQTYLINQAKQRGTLDNQLTALMQTSNNAQKALGPNATPFDQIMYDYLFGGGEIGKKKASATSDQTPQFLTFNQAKNAK